MRTLVEALRRAVLSRYATTKTNQKYLKFSRSAQLTDLVCGVAKDGENPIGDSVAVYESCTVEVVMPGPGDGEVGVGLIDVDWIGIAIARQSNGQPLGRIQQPGIAGVGGKQRQRADADKAPVVEGRTALDVTHFIGQAPVLAHYPGTARRALDGGVLGRFLSTSATVRFLWISSPSCLRSEEHTSELQS